MGIRRLVFAVSVAIWASAVYAGDFSDVSDLLQVYREALLSDTRIGSASAALRAGREKNIQARSVLLPTIGLSGAYLYNDSDTVPNVGKSIDANYRTRTAALTLSQPLYRAANWQQYEQGKLAESAAEIQFAQAQQDLIVRVAQAYFDVLAAQDGVRFVQAQKMAISEQLAAAKRNFEIGTATITDTHESQARYDLVVAQELIALNEVEVKQSALQQITGKPSAALAPLKPNVIMSAPEPVALSEWMAFAEKQNYMIMLAQIARESAQREIEKNRSGHYPTLDLVASSTRSGSNGNATTGIGATNTTQSVGVQWVIPIFSGFSVDSKVRESIALKEKAEYDLELAKRDAQQATRQFFLSVNSGLSQISALEAAELSSQSALASNQLGYQVGVRINIDVLNAQQQLFATEQSLSKARYDTVLNGLRLKAVAGVLKESDVVELNASLFSSS